MAPGLNDTNICLIPKTTKPNEMSKFRPISLCNVSYKIISKVLCQGLKKVLPQKVRQKTEFALSETFPGSVPNVSPPWISATSARLRNLPSYEAANPSYGSVGDFVFSVVVPSSTSSVAAPSSSRPAAPYVSLCAARTAF